MNRKKTVIIGVIVAVAVGAAAAWYFLAPTAQMSATTMEAGADAQRKPLYWTDPMVPGFKTDKPGKSPFMDMQLVPVYADEADAQVVSIQPEIVQNLGVRTYTVERNNRGISIPREALIRTGTRIAVVLAIGKGQFKPVDVTPGPELGDSIEIRQGIKVGDVVVTSGQFLIDSEASVRASFQRMEPAAGSGPQ